MIEVVAGRPRHAALILPRLRAEEKREIAALGIAPRSAVLRLMICSTLCRALFLDGEIAALGGLSSGLMSAEARAWLLTTEAVERRPLAFVRFMQGQITEALERYRLVTADATADSPRTLRLWRMLGGRLGPPTPLGRRGELFQEIRWEVR